MNAPTEKELMGMLKSLAVFLVISTVVGVLETIRTIDLFQRSDYSARAAYQIPNSTITLILDRRHVHLFLAEYERTLILRVDGEDVLRLEAAIDTGGYSRMNVFQISDHEYLLIGRLSFDTYLIDVSAKSITPFVAQR